MPTPIQIVKHTNLVWAWRIRCAVAAAAGIVTLFLVVLSLARLTGADVVNWPRVLFWLITNYGELLLSVIRFVANAVRYFGLEKLADVILKTPIWVLDVFSIYVLFGNWVRLSVISIIFQQEKVGLDLGPEHADDFSLNQGADQYRKLGRREARKMILIWPLRVWSDARQKFWTLSPLRVLALLIVSFVLLGLAVYAYG
ncbi:hypothetical protein [Ruegeria arenilitoris]|uniref:hypothetical protein n=1 Tax=Ruegeria arenilitoris TaxID=1173585 RepID=UPI00147FE92D|nr:hypothetical protein [Ruegeria arenilitoris]